MKDYLTFFFSVAPDWSVCLSLYGEFRPGGGSHPVPNRKRLGCSEGM